jgi:hypothetical protein
MQGPSAQTKATGSLQVSLAYLQEDAYKRAGFMHGLSNSASGETVASSRLRLLSLRG